MGQGFELTGWAATLALSVPFVLLVIALLLGTRARRKRPIAGPVSPSASQPPPQPEPRPEPLPQTASAAEPSRPPTVRATDAASTFAPAEVSAPAPPAEAPQPASGPAPTPAGSEPEPTPAPDPVEVARETAARLSAEIKDALSSGREKDAVSLYISEAEALAVMGQRAAAADRLRKSILLSAARGMKPEHALARLELGDLARHEGDLTTACEHWSIARSLMHELKIADGIKEAEGRIRNHGCPTDWVLNDF